MAFPQIAATAVYTDDDVTTDQTRHVSLPAASAGQLLLMVFRAGLDGSITVPSGWTLKGTINSLAGAFASQGPGQTHVLARIADGTEGATVAISDVGTSQFVRAVAITRAISGWYGDLDDGVAVAMGDQPDPPELNHGWGSDDVLWFTGIAGRRTQWNATRPSGWSEGGFASNPATSSTSLFYARMYDAYRELEAASEDPGSWLGFSEANAGHVWTIAVRPPGFPAVSLPVLLGLPTLQVIDPGIPVVLFSPTVLLGLNNGVPTFSGTFVSQVTTSSPGLPLGISVARALQEIDLLNQDIAAPIVTEARVNGTGLSVRLVRVRKTVSGLEVSVATPDPGPFSGVLAVRAGYLLPQFGAVMDELARVTISRAEISRTAKSRDSLLIGTDQTSAEGAVRERPLRGISFRSVTDGKVRIRCKVDVYANPGDLAVLPGGETLRVQEVVYVLTPSLAFMEVVG